MPPPHKWPRLHEEFQANIDYFRALQKAATKNGHDFSAAGYEAEIAQLKKLQKNAPS